MTKIVWKSLLKEMIKNTINSQTGACININQRCQRVTRRRPRQRHFREKKQRATRIKSCTGSVRNVDGIQVNIRQYFCNHFTNVSNIVNFLTQSMWWPRQQRSWPRLRSNCKNTVSRLSRGKTILGDSTFLVNIEIRGTVSKKKCTSENKRSVTFLYVVSSSCVCVLTWILVEHLTVTSGRTANSAPSL